MGRAVQLMFAVLASLSLGIAVIGDAAAADNAAAQLDAAVGKLLDWNTPPPERVAALSTLRNAGSRSLDHVRSLLKSNVWAARRDGLSLAADLAAPDLARILAEGLADKNWAIREHAANLAVNMNPANRAGLEAELKDLLGDPISRVRLAGYKTLATWNPEGDYVAQALTDSDPDVSYWAAQRYMQRVQTGKLTPEAKTRLIDSVVARFQASRWTNMDSAGLSTLFSLGPGAQDALYEAMSAEPVQLRQQAVSAVGSMAGRGGVDLMFRFLGDPDPNVRVAAMNNVASHCTESQAPRLFEILNTNDDMNTRHQVLQALGRLRYRPAIPRLLELSRQQDPGLRRSVFNALAQMGDRSIAPKLIEMYQAEPQGWMRGQMIPPIVQSLGSEAGPFLREALRDSDRSVRQNALYALRSALKPDERADLLIRVVNEEEDDNVRQIAISSLGETQSDRVAEALAGVLRDGGQPARRAAAWALSRQRSTRAVQAVVDACAREEDPSVREALISALAQVRDPRAVPLLKKALNSEDAQIRASALNALAQFGDALSDEFLVGILAKEEDESVLRACINLASGRHINDERLVPKLGKLMESPQNDIRSAAVNCLTKIDGLLAAQLLCKVIKDEGSAGVRRAAVDSLVSRITAKKVAVGAIAKPLGEALEGPDDAARGAIISALASLGDRALAPIFLKTLKSDTDGAVRSAAAKAMERVADASMVPQLIEAAKAEEKPETIAVLIGALGQLGDRRALPFFRESLQSSDPGVQAAALRAFASFRDASLIPFYVERFKQSTSVEVRLSSLRNVKDSADRRTLDILLLAFKDSDARVRRAAAEALVQFSDPRVAAVIERAMCAGESVGSLIEVLSATRLRSSADVLLAAAQKPDDEATLRRIYAALGKVGDRRAVPILAESVRRNDSADVTRAALDALVELGAVDQAPLCLDLAKREIGAIADVALNAGVRLNPGPEAVGLVKERFLNGTELQKRESLGLLIAAAGPDDRLALAAGAGASLYSTRLPSVLPPDKPEGLRLVREIALSDAAPEAVVAALTVLDRNPTENRDVFERVFSSTRPEQVRAAALVSLGIALSRREEDTEALRALVAKQINSPEPELKRAALRCAAMRAVPELLKDIVAAAQAGSGDMRREAVLALGAMRNEKGAETTLIELLGKADDPALAVLAVRSLGLLRSAAAVPNLAAVLESSDLPVRAAAVDALGAIGSPDAVKAVEKAFEQKDVDQLRAAAALVLGLRKNAEYVPRLVEGLKSGPGLDVQAACAEALGEMGAAEARAPLVVALAHDSGRVRESAVRALGSLNAKDLRSHVETMVEDTDVRVAAAAKQVLNEFDTAGALRGTVK